MLYTNIFQHVLCAFNSIQLPSHVQLFVTPWTAAHHDSLSITNSWSLLKLMSIKSVLPSNHLILCHPLLLLASIFPTIKDIFDKSVLCILWPSTGVSASTSVPPMNIQNWFLLVLTGWLSLKFKGLSRFFSNTTAQKHQFFSAQLSLQSNSHTDIWLLKKPWFWLDGSLSVKQYLCFLIWCLGWS